MSAIIYVDDRENALERFSNKTKEKKLSPMHYFDKVIDADNRINGSKTPQTGGGVVSFQVKRLTIADYCISIRTPEGKNVVVAAVERKRWKDLASTITGSRSETQPRDLRMVKMKYGCHVYYLAEGSMTYNDDFKIGGGGHGQPFKALHSKLRRETIRGIPFIQTKDPEHTVQMLIKMARDFIKMRFTEEITFPLQESNIYNNKLLAAYAYQIKKINDDFKKLIESELSDIQKVPSEYQKVPSEYQKVPSEYQKVLFAIQSMEEELQYNTEQYISDTPESIVDFTDEEFNLPKVFTKVKQAGMSDIISNMWEAIPGITKNSAPLISETYTFSDLFGCDEDNYEQLKEEISQMKFASGTRIGRQADKIMNNFKTDKSKRQTGIAVLCAIPRVTELIAKKILSEYSIEELYERYLDEDDLKNIMIGNKKLGPALSKKILEVINHIKKEAHKKQKAQETLEEQKAKEKLQKEQEKLQKEQEKLQKEQEKLQKAQELKEILQKTQQSHEKLQKAQELQETQETQEKLQSVPKPTDLQKTIIACI